MKEQRSGLVGIIEKADHLVSKFFNAITIVSVLAVVAVILMSVVDVVGSKLFSKPFAPAYEMTQMLSIPLTFFAVGSVQMGRGMMRIDLVATHLPKIVQKICNIFGSILGIVVCVFLAHRSWIYSTQTLLANHMKTTGNIKLIMWPFAMILVIGLYTLALAYVFTFLRYILNYDVLPDLSPDEIMAAENAEKGMTPEENLQEIYPDIEMDKRLVSEHPGMQGIVLMKKDDAVEASEEAERGDQ